MKVSFEVNTTKIWSIAFLLLILAIFLPIATRKKSKPVGKPDARHATPKPGKPERPQRPLTPEEEATRDRFIKQRLERRRKERDEVRQARMSRHTEPRKAELLKETFDMLTGIFVKHLGDSFDFDADAMPDAGDTGAEETVSDQPVKEIVHESE